MATAKKKSTQKTAMHNPPSSKFAAGGKKTPAKRNTAVAKRGTTKVAKKTYRRNPSPGTNAVLAAIGGALALVVFNEGVNRFAPNFSAVIKIGSKVAAGWAIGNWGPRLLGQWARVAQGALWLMAAYEGFDLWVRPYLGGWVTSAPAVISQQAVKNTQTGQLGTRYMLNDGNSFDVFEDTGQMAYAN